MTKAERLRKLYENKLGESLVSKLSDAQIKLVSKYYNSLDNTSDIDSKIFQGRNDTELHEMARTLVEEEEESEDIPEGLDDLLGSIKDEEPEPSGALAVYVPDSREEDLVSEEIDERILTILGLDDAIDLDYATYKSLLKEKMMAGRMSGSEMPSEETELITDECKRVKANTGRFKVKKNKINFDSFMGEVTEKKEEEESRPTTEMLSLPGTTDPERESQAVTPKAPEEETDKIEGIQKFLGGVAERLENIEKNLSDMLDLETETARVEKKEVEGDRITGEKQKKRKRENEREGGVLGSIAKTIGDKVTAPVKGFFETLLNFFTQIFLGSVIMEIIKILDNPLVIFNPFIAIVNKLLDFLNGILNLVFPGIIGGINLFTGLLNGGIGNLENVVNGVFGLFGNVEEEDKFTLPKIPEAQVPQIEKIPYFKANFEKTQEKEIEGKSGGGEVAGYNEGGQVAGYNEGKSGGGEVAGYNEGGQVINLNVGGWNGGTNIMKPVGGWNGGTNIMKPVVGMVGGGMLAMSGFAGGGQINSGSGETISGMGPDTQLIAAQPGEIVMSKKAVQAYGANNLLAMNRGAGGTNIPTMGSVQGFQGGGLVRDVTFSAGHAPTRANYNRRIPVGADGENVQGTRDTRTSDQYSTGGAMAGMNPTQVAEYEATMHLVDTMRRMVEGTPIAKVIKFQNIETSAGLKDVPRAVEANQGSQFVDLHFDRRMYNTNKATGGKGQGYRGAMMGRNRSAVDRALMSQYGEHPAYNASDYGVISGGGTILEMAAIDDPAIRPYLEEVRDRKQGPASEAMARQLLLSTLNGIEGGEALKQTLMRAGVTQPRGNIMPSVEPQVTVAPVRTPPQPSPKAAKAKRTLTLIDRAMAAIDEKRKNNTGSGDKVVVPGVGSYVEGTTMGFIPTNKYFNPNGEEISKAVFDERLTAARKSQQTIIKNNPPIDVQSTTHKGPVIKSSSEPPNPPPPPSAASQTTVMAAPVASGGSPSMNMASPGAGQKEVPFFSSRDMGNTEFIVIKSIYNIVG